MMIALGISSVILFILWWLAVMHAWYVTEHHAPQLPLTTQEIVARLRAYTRLMRRLWYAATKWAHQISVGTTKKLATLFVRIFPQSAQAFTKRDTLSGLTEGPSSYFLKSISEEMAKPKKTRRSSKIV